MEARKMHPFRNMCKNVTSCVQSKRKTMDKTRERKLGGAYQASFQMPFRSIEH